MENSEKKFEALRYVLALAGAAAFYFSDSMADSAWLLFLTPVVAVIIYLWLGVAFFFIDMIWRLIAKPDERLFASIMLGSNLFITAALLAAYWLIKDSIGIGATIMYAIGAYGVFSVAGWFRRHTASYYANLQAQKRASNSTTTEQN